MEMEALTPRRGRSRRRSPRWQWLLLALLALYASVEVTLGISRLGSTAPTIALIVHVLAAVPLVGVLAVMVGRLRPVRPSRLTTFGVLVLAAAAGVAATLFYAGPARPELLIRHPGSTDFAMYYGGAKVALTQGWSHLYDTGRPGGTDFWTPPPLALLLFPLVALPLPAALALWEAATVIGLVPLLRHLWPGDREARAAQVGILALLPALPYVFVLGQSSMVAFLAVGWGWWLARTGHPIAAGVVLVASGAKPQLVFLLPVALLAAGCWRVLAGGLAGGLAVGALALLLIGGPELARWAASVVDVGLHPAAWSVPPATLQSLLPAVLVWPATALVIVLVAVAARVNRTLEVVLAIGLLGSLLASPHVRDDDFALLLLSGWLLLRSGARGLEAMMLLVSWAVVACAFVFGLRAVIFVEMGWLIWFTFRPVLERASTRLPGLQGAPAIAAP